MMLQYPELIECPAATFLQVRVDDDLPKPSRPSFLDKNDTVFAVDFFHQEADFFVRRRRAIFSDEVGFNREFAMSAIHQDGKLNCCRSAEIDQRIERGTNRSTGIQNVIDQDDILAGNIEHNVRSFEDRLIQFASKIITVQCYI